MTITYFGKTMCMASWMKFCPSPKWFVKLLLMFLASFGFGHEQPPPLLGYASPERYPTLTSVLAHSIGKFLKGPNFETHPKFYWESTKGLKF